MDNLLVTRSSNFVILTIVFVSRKKICERVRLFRATRLLRPGVTAPSIPPLVTALNACTD